MDVGRKFQEILMWCLILISLPLTTLTLENPVITSSGAVMGTEFFYGGDIVQSYLGIPFAQPPIGNLRFRETVPVKPWKETLQATYFPPACYQTQYPSYPWTDTMTDLSEDCLYLNIWVPPNTNKESKKAVMFWIFSGAFKWGSNRLPVYDGQVLATKGDVIVVTINYRLGMLGFLSARTKENPGNMGLLDQIEALKWVKKNIDSFGGDSSNITIFGQSAGSISSGMLCVSPLSKGLFQRVIMQSGSPAVPSNDNTMKNGKLAQKIAEAVGCASAMNNFALNPDGIIECLRTKDAKLLIETTNQIEPNIVTFSTIVGDTVLPIEPKVQLMAGIFHKVDLLIGNVQDEGSFILTLLGKDEFGYFGHKNEDPKFSKTVGGSYIRTFFKDLPSKDLIVNYYLGDLEDNDYKAIREQTYHALADPVLVCSDTYFAESYAKKGYNVYAYYFNHIPSVTPWAEWMGSEHFDEVAFVFGRPLDHPFDYTRAEQCLSRKMIRMWTNFAKTGSPCDNWTKFSSAQPYFEVFKTNNRNSYLESHLKNCEFLRPIFFNV